MGKKMDSSKNGPDYSSVEYWNERYKDEDHYEWLSQGYVKMLTLLENSMRRTKHNKKDPKILILGCGNSKLSLDLYDRGFHSILSTDISPICIERQLELNRSSRPGLEWSVLDMTDMSQLEEESFDFVIEKATLDAILVNEKSPWTVSEETGAVIHRTMIGISRILEKGGQFFSLSFRQPHFRCGLFAPEMYDWSVEHCIVNEGDMFHFYCFTMTKGEKCDKTTQLQGVNNSNSTTSDDPCLSDDGEEFLLKIE